MIETEKLYLKPLTYTQLLLYVQEEPLLEQELQVKPTSRTISPELKEALETSILPNVKDEHKNYLYYTLWTIIAKHENTMVGDLCFIGEPNADGAVEIGYGTYEAFQGKGYMTEAVSGIMQWAKTQPNIKTILASTEKSNVASSNVLKKNKFKQIGETETLYHWQFICS